MSHLEPSYLRYIYDGLEKGDLHPDNAAALPEGLIGLYEAAFEENKSPRERQKLIETFATWALLKKEVSAQFVAEILDVPTQEIIDFIATYSNWFTSPESGKYQLYHERLKVYLLQKLSEKEIQKQIFQIFQKLEKYFDSELRDENNEYSLYYFLDYYHIIVNLDQNLDIKSELHQVYFLKVKKDATRLFYLENGRNHRERHLKEATKYFTRKRDLKVLDNLVHEINNFQNKFKSPLELSKLISSSDKDDYYYGYNLCIKLEDKLFVLVYFSIYHNDSKLSDWHLTVIKEYWNEIRPTKKIYDLPSFFLMDLVPFLIDLKLYTYKEIEVKNIDFRLIQSAFGFNSFYLLKNQRYDKEDFLETFSTQINIDILLKDEINYRLKNENYFSQIDLLNNISNINDLKFIINPIKYFDLPTNDELKKIDSISFIGKISKKQFSELFYNKTNDFFSIDKEFIKQDKARSLIILNCIKSILDGDFNLVIEYLSYLKTDIKYGYTRDSIGAIYWGDDAWAYNEMIFSIYNYGHFRDILSIKELEEFLFVVIKDNKYFDKFYDIYSYKYIISNTLLTESDEFNKLIISERTKCVSCNYLYFSKSRVDALELLSKLNQFKINENQNYNFYQINFANGFSNINLDEKILIDYYRNIYDIRSGVLPAIQYGIKKNNLPLIWNFLHVNQSDMQEFGKSRSFAWYSLSALFSLNFNKFTSVYEKYLIPLLEFVHDFSENHERKTSILLDFVEPIESVDLFELLSCLKIYFNSNYISKYENLLFDKESKNQKNLENLNILKNVLLKTVNNIWNKSSFKEELKNDIIKLQNENNFINNHYHNLLLLNLYFDHPEYINSISIYSKLFKKYNVKPKPLVGKTRLVSNQLIEQLKWKNNLVHLDISPSNLMYSNYIIGQGYFKNENFKKSIKYFKRCIENKTDYSGVNLWKCYLELGKSYYNINSFKKAIESLNIARLEIKKIKDNLSELSNIYYYLGLCYGEKKKWVESISNYIACRNIDKRILEKAHNDHLTVLYSILNISRELNEKYHVKYLKELIYHLKFNTQNKNHEIGYYYLTLARKYRENEEYKLELHYLKKCIKNLNSTHYKTNTSRIKIHFLLAKAYEKNNLYLKAIKISKIIEIENTNIISEYDLFSLMARCAYKSKTYKLALNFYLKIDFDNSLPIISYRIAQCYEQLNSIDNALHNYIKYLDKKSVDDVLLEVFKETGDEDFIDFSEEELVKALEFIQIYSYEQSKIEDWILKLIEIKNANN